MATEIKLEGAEEVKNAYLSVLNDNLWDLKQLNETLISFKQFLSETVKDDLRFEYESQKATLHKIEEDLSVYRLKSQEIINAIDDIDSEFNQELMECVERLSLINIDKYKVQNSAKIEYTYKSWIAKNNYQVELREFREVPSRLTFDDLMKTSLTRAMKKQEYDTFMKANLGGTIDSEERYIQYISLMYKSAEFDHITELEGIMNTLTNILGIIAIGSGLLIMSGGIFGFTVPGYVAAAGQVAGGLLTAKDIGHLITGKDINGNPLSEEDKHAIISSLVIEGSMLAVSSFSKLRLKYANKVSDVNEINSNVKILNYETTSGVRLEATPGKTTTVLGRYEDDTKHILGELGNIKSTDFGPCDGGFNLLNTPDELFKNPEQFWVEYNKPWLDNAIERGDIIKLATRPTPDNLYNFKNKINSYEITGFGREFMYLQSNGYMYDPFTMSMIKKEW